MHPNAARANRYNSLGSLILACAAAAMLAGCGGGTQVSSTTSSTTTTSTAPVAKSLQLLAGATTMPSAGGSTSAVALTAIVLDTNNNALTGQTITFDVIDPVAQSTYVNNVSNTGISDSNGQVTASLNLGANKSNRSVTVTASVIPAQGQSAITATVIVAVSGTSITFGGGTQLVFGKTLPVTAVLTDSAKNPIPGQVLTFASTAGNHISPATATTDINGSTSFVVTGTVGGADVIAASGAGTSVTEKISVNSSNFLFQSPATGALVNINTPQPITLHWDNAGVNEVGQPILFSATRGTLSATTVNTDINGNATTSITSAGAGPTSITAVGPQGTPAATPLNLTFVTTSASQVSLQAAQASIPVNAVGSTTNQTSLLAIVRDINNNLVQGATVNFNIVTDPSGGTLSVPSAVTDVSGTASVSYIAGSTSSGSNQVLVTATVVSVNGVSVPVPLTATVTMTVAGQSLFIRLQTDETIQSGATGEPAASYSKTWYALVTDAAGNPVSGANIVFTVKPVNPPLFAYSKGQYTPCTGLGTSENGPDPLCTALQWQITTPVYNCYNEDLNYTGIYEASEDLNGSGQLLPGNITTVSPLTPAAPPANQNVGVTDASGFAGANITYLKNYATWGEVVLTASTTVSGTEYIQTVNYYLIGSAQDFGASPPSLIPGATSPFGVNPCNQLN